MTTIVTNFSCQSFSLQDVGNFHRSATCGLKCCLCSTGCGGNWAWYPDVLRAIPQWCCTAEAHFVVVRDVVLGVRRTVVEVHVDAVQSML